MNKNRFLFLTVFAISIILPLDVSAITFKNGDTVHIFERMTNACGENYLIDEYISDGNYKVSNDEGEEKKLTKDNQCVELTQEDKNIMFTNSVYSYNLEISDEKKYLITKKVRSSLYEDAYYSTQDKQIDENKTYYTFDKVNVEMLKVTTPNVSNINTYYEKGKLTINADLKKIEGQTYFKRLGSYILDGQYLIFQKEEYDSSYATNYYVLSEGDDTETILELDFEKFEKIYAEKSIDSDIVEKVGNEFILKLIDSEGLKTHVYDIEGNFIDTISYQDDTTIYKMAENLYLVGRNIRNISGNTLYFFEDMDYIYNYSFDEYSGIMYGEEQTGNQLIYSHRIYKMLKTEYINNEVKITTSGNKNLLKRILINNNELNTNNYSLENGSTIITLKSEYLKTLANGTYTIKVEYTDGGYTESTFTIDENLYIEYKVIFDANGGKFKDTDKYIIEDWNYTDYDNLKLPTRDGYTFKGYYTEKTGGTKLEMILNESGIDSNTTFYAQWEENSVIVPSKTTEENPKTFDGIGSSIITGTISLIGLVGATLYFKKRNKTLTDDNKRKK